VPILDFKKKKWRDLEQTKLKLNFPAFHMALKERSKAHKLIPKSQTKLLISTDKENAKGGSNIPLLPMLHPVFTFFCCCKPDVNAASMDFMTPSKQQPLSPFIMSPSVEIKDTWAIELFHRLKVAGVDDFTVQRLQGQMHNLMQTISWQHNEMSA
jgi:hypothetical protein